MSDPLRGPSGRSQDRWSAGVDQTFARRFAAIGLACLLCLIAVTGARISLLREQGRAEAVEALQTAAAGPPAGFAGRMDALLAGDRRWRAVVCYGPGGALRFGGVRTSQGIRSTTELGSAASTSLATAQVRADSSDGRCVGLVQALDGDEVYPVIRDTAVAAIALLAIGALALLAMSIRGRRGDPPPLPARIPAAGFTPDTASGAPADPASKTTRRTRHGPH